MAERSQADQVLLDQIQQGDADAWQRLVDLYRGRLLAFARSRLRDAAEAEDILQDTFVCFLRGLEDFRAEASIETYLFTILRRRIIDWYRGRKVNVCYIQDLLDDSQDARGRDPVGMIASPTATASWYAANDEAGDALSEALSQALRLYVNDLKQAMNLRDLKIVELLFYAQVPNKEAGRLLEMDEKQIALIKHRALKKIQAHVQRSLRDQGGLEKQHDLPDALLTGIWERMRPSCPKRNTIGAWLLGSLGDDWAEYVAFHLEQLGCHFCQANLADLRKQTAQENEVLRERILASTVGFLRQSYRREAGG
jgi:RNA polymerase sigma factor (sigma-70 family)